MEQIGKIGEQTVDEPITRELKANYGNNLFNLPVTNIVSDVTMQFRAEGDLARFPNANGMGYAWLLKDIDSNITRWTGRPSFYEYVYPANGVTITLPQTAINGGSTLAGIDLSWDSWGMVSYYLTIHYTIRRIVSLWDQIQSWFQNLVGGVKIGS
jgi:hypothetical protein